MCPYILLSSSSIAFWCRLIILFLLLGFHFLFNRDFRSYSLLLYFRLLFYFFWLCLLFLFLLFEFSLLFGFLFFLLFLPFFNFLLGLKLLKVSFASVDNDLLCFFLICKKISVPPQKSKDWIKESINVSFLLDDGHQNSVKFILFVHVDNI